MADYFATKDGRLGGIVFRLNHHLYIQQGERNTMATELTATTPRQATRTSDEGTTTIDNVVVAKIVAAAAQEIGGIHGMGSGGMGGTLSGALSSVTGALPGGSSNQPSTQGVAVEVGNEEALVNLNIIVDYGARIPQVVEALRRNISDRLQTLTGLTTRAVNVEVSDVFFPEQQPSRPASGQS